MILLLLKLLIGHALADFSLQTDPMANGKNWKNKPKYIPEGQKYVPCWPYWMTAHAFVHGGAVLFITGSAICCVLEIISHWVIDTFKCANITNPNQDQFLHFLMKIVYCLILFYCI